MPDLEIPLLISVMNKGTLNVEEKKEIVKMLIDHHADVTKIDNNGNTLLHVATSSGNLELVTLFAQKCDIHARNDHGHTALSYAFLNPDQNIASFLMRHGAKIDVKDKEENTILAQSVLFKGDLAVERILKLGSININEKNKHHQTALDMAKTLEPLSELKKYMDPKTLPNYQELYDAEEKKIKRIIDLLEAEVHREKHKN